MLAKTVAVNAKICIKKIQDKSVFVGQNVNVKNHRTFVESIRPWCWHRTPSKKEQSHFLLFFIILFFLFYTKLFIFCVLLFSPPLLLMKIMSFPHQSTIQKPVKYHPRLNMRRRMCYTSLSVFALCEVKPLVVSWLKPSFKFQSA